MLTNLIPTEPNENRHSIILHFIGKRGTVSDSSTVMDSDDLAFWPHSLSLNTVTYSDIMTLHRIAEQYERVWHREKHTSYGVR